MTIFSFGARLTSCAPAASRDKLTRLSFFAHLHLASSIQIATLVAINRLALDNSSTGIWQSIHLLCLLSVGPRLISPRSLLIHRRHPRFAQPAQSYASTISQCLFGRACLLTAPLPLLLAMPRPTRVAKAAGTESLPNTPGGFDEAHERKVQARLLKSLEKQGRKSTSSSSGNSSDGLQLSTRKEAIEQWDAVSRQEGNSGQANGRPRANGQRRLSFENVIRAGKDEMSENIFLFVPNLIGEQRSKLAQIHRPERADHDVRRTGYSRIILAALSLYFMEGNPKNCTVLYCISCLLDAFDGMAARALGQSTKFGAVLDMVTDRCTTSCLLCFLTARYPRCALLFQGLITLDFSSHYIHMYA